MVNNRRLFRSAGQGFTLIELLVVLAAIGLLLSIAAPRYVQHVDRAREAALRSNLAAMRDALDKFQSDKGHYPAKLQELVDTHYLRSVPVDPFTEQVDSWILLPPGGNMPGMSPEGMAGIPNQIADVRSSAPGTARNGSTYASW